MRASCAGGFTSVELMGDCEILYVKYCIEGLDRMVT